MPSIAPKDIFHFFDLPPELRDNTYSYLTKPGPTSAKIKPSSSSSDSVTMKFNGIWLTPLLLVSKQFGQEYFDKVCERLVCHTFVSRHRDGITAGGVAPQENPVTAVKALAKARRLMTTDQVADKEDLAAFIDPFNGVLPGLLRMMPKLQTWEEGVMISSMAVITSVENGDASFLRAIYDHYWRPNKKQQKFREILDGHGITREVTYFPWALVSSHISSDIITKKNESGGWITFMVIPKLEDPGNENEQLWYGLELQPAVMLEEEGNTHRF